MPLNLRPATANDAAEVATVYLASRKAFLPFAPLAHSDTDVCTWIREKLIPSGAVTVAEQESRIIGMMAISSRDEISWIDQLYIAPDSVNQGVGTRLLELAKQRLASPVRLFTFQQNSAARRFYERNGFRVIALSDGQGNEEKCPDALYEFCDPASADGL